MITYKQRRIDMESLLVFMRMIITMFYLIASILSTTRFKDEKKALYLFGGLGVINIIFSFIGYMNYGQLGLGVVFCLCFIIPTIILLTVLNDESFFKMIFNLLTIVHSVIILALLGSTYNLFFYDSLFVDVLLRLIVGSAFLIFFRYYLNSKDFSYKNYQSQSWKTLCIVPFAYLFIVVFYGGFSLTTEIFPYMLAIYVIMFITYFIIFKMMRDESKVAFYQNIQNQINLQLEQQNQFIHSIEDHDQSMRLFRHDFHHHLNIIKNMLDNHCQEAIDYINNLLDEKENVEIENYCDQFPINAVLSLYLKKAHQKGISLKINIDSHIYVSIPINQLCVILANSIDNAIGALDNVKDPYLHISMHMFNQILTIEIINPYVGKIQFDNDHLPISSKGELHGFGVRSISQIVNQANGQFRISTSHHIFKLQITIS